MIADSPSSRKRPDQSHPALCWAIAQRIQHSPNQRITFAEFMDMALYHPEHGYYASRRQRIGGKGDFVTSPHLGADFGELLAEQFAEMWAVLGHPRPFHLVEMGAGQGLIMRDVLNYLHRVYVDCFEAVEYLVVEKSDVLIAEQKHHIASLSDAQSRIRWCQWDDIPADSITGCFFSNELVDAFPVHQLMLEDGNWQEIYISLSPSTSSSSTSSPFTFIEVIAPPSTPQLQTYFPWVGVEIDASRYANGYRTEVNLAALDWVNTVSSRLHRGYVLTIDYGYTASRYYSPARSQGTLQCYYQHAHHSDPYQHIGHQDITAHVDFSALERRGEEAGLATLGRIEQGLFLMALGLGDRLSALSKPETIQALSANDILRCRDALHTLMNPMGLGNFQVLLQSKGLKTEAASKKLKGFDIPPMSI
ncbi:MAG: class I SAM-dependent methyltransferase [Cyanobacteria bacterium P01_E01_bin.6]